MKAMIHQNESRGKVKMTKLYQLNARLPETSKAQLEEIVQNYRSKMPIGKLSQADVIQILIQEKYDKIKEESQK